MSKTSAAAHSEAPSAALWQARATGAAGPVCLVVGIGPGIGASCARKYAREGYQVAVASRTQEKVDALAAEIGGRGYAYDAGNEAQVRMALMQMTVDFGQPIHTIIYNAGSGNFKPLAEITAEMMQTTYQTNVMGLFHHVKVLEPDLGTGTRVIGITGATASYRGMPITYAFAPGKMAQRGLAQAMARDLGPKGVHVFLAIVDGGVGEPDTDPPRKIHPDAIADAYFYVAHQPPTCWTFEVPIVAQAAFGSMATI